MPSAYSQAPLHWSIPQSTHGEKGKLNKDNQENLNRQSSFVSSSYSCSRAPFPRHTLLSRSFPSSRVPLLTIDSRSACASGRKFDAQL
ncbi:hypothetical protein AKJ16_DCAP11969 [Drosera capensis]